MAGLNHLNKINDNDNVTSKETKEVNITGKNSNDFPTPDMLDENGKVDPRKTAEKAKTALEGATKEKDTAEKNGELPLLSRIGKFFSGIFNKSPEKRTDADQKAIEDYKAAQQKLSQESKQTLPESYASNNSLSEEKDKN
ncbi:MAG: hypothetical protein LBG59_06255 [Candidatus Peribacteria bacterium]|jgi:hypothetical protein|nr:hypothetical protein [Candidatus Peribacteria bacterium]